MNEMGDSVLSPRKQQLPTSKKNGSARSDDWLRELFSGTYDLREAEAMRRRRYGYEAASPSVAEKDER
jgi:hypothetical protein